MEALGFSEVPTAGDEFEVYPDEKSARAVVGDRASDARATRLAQQMASRRVSLTAMSGQANDGELKELNLILKADVQILASGMETHRDGMHCDCPVGEFEPVNRSHYYL